jgi:hypothetical protein
MKKILFLFAMMITFSFSFAQKTNLIFFTEGGEKFYVILNGVLQNAKAETNVKVTDLTAPNYKLKVLFEDTTIAALDKNLLFQQSTETTFNIKKNNKNEYVVRYLSEVPIAEAVPPPAGQSVIVYAASGPSAPVTTTTISTTQTTTSGVGTTHPADGVSVGINVNGLNMNMNITDPTMSGTVGTTSSSTTMTTTTTTSTTGTQVVPVTTQPQTYSMPGYTGTVGCPYPMSEADFASAKTSISSKSFEDSKLTIAKQIMAANCLLCTQVKEIMMLFSFEDTKLELAKYAYGYTFDIGNYYKLNDAFTFESSIDELNTYITAHPK